ncbi:MAG: cell division protein ZapA [Pseudoxanthomonas suwonensis]|nr:cell division protein ZapA [Pseudoxanthomonas suwonensis]
MSQGTEPVNVSILDREYTVGVLPEERESLTAAARMLEAKMREIRGSNRMVAIDRVAVLAALNLAHELHQLRGDGDRSDDDVERVLASMQRKLDRFDAL